MDACTNKRTVLTCVDAGALLSLIGVVYGGQQLPIFAGCSGACLFSELGTVSLGTDFQRQIVPLGKYYIKFRQLIARFHYLAIVR